MICPKCNSDNVVKNGSIHNGKQKFKCKNCQRQFVDNPKNKRITLHVKQLVDKLFLERISLAGICRAIGVSNGWLYSYIRDKYIKTFRKLKVSPKKKGEIAVQMDELCAEVENKGNKQWVWIALDVKNREIIGLHIGDRSQKSARDRRDSLPAVYRQCAVYYTDFLDAYQCVLPTKRHRPSSKKSGKTSLIERFNCTLRQRVSRLVRKSLSFSKDTDNHRGAIWYFIHDYNFNLNLLE